MLRFYALRVSLLDILASPLRKNKAPAEPPKFSVPEGATLFHITHYKAGSQWFRNVMLEVFGENGIVQPLTDRSQLFSRPIEVSKAYPCGYVTAEEFATFKLPSDTRKAVVIRDLRDTLVSGYFSIAATHELSRPFLKQARELLTTSDKETGLIFLLDKWLEENAKIQRSWVGRENNILKLEDFMRNPAKALRRLFCDCWGLSVSRRDISWLAKHHQFSRYSQGRKPGQEDASSHFRKGVHGDWRQHFTPKVVSAFKDTYGRLLIDAGYERNMDW